MMSGCATIDGGTTKGVIFKTVPADAQVYEVTGKDKKLKEKVICKKTPCKVQLFRGSSHHIVIKKVGYKKFDILIKSVGNNAGESIGQNLLLTGVASPILDGVDALDGADATLKPNSVYVQLTKEIAPIASTISAVSTASTASTVSVTK